MRVLQLVTTASSFFRQQVTALEAQGVECTTVAVPDPDGPLGTPGAYARFYRRALSAGTGDYDLVHANYGLVGPFALAQPTRPLVLSLWGSDLLSDSTRLRAVSGLTADRADAVVVPSDRAADACDVPHHVVPFPLDTDRFAPMPRDEAREAVGWDTDDTVVLFPYHPDRTVKNYPLAERVVDAVDDRVDGSVDLRWVWGVPHEEVPLYMNASDAVLVPSDRESGPMVVKEAAACNVPVVATDVGFARSVLGPVEHSYVRDSPAELVDALERVVASGERSDGRAVIDATTTEAMGQRLKDVYADVLDEGTA